MYARLPAAKRILNQEGGFLLCMWKSEDAELREELQKENIKSKKVSSSALTERMKMRED